MQIQEEYSEVYFGTNPRYYLMYAQKYRFTLHDLHLQIIIKLQYFIMLQYIITQYHRGRRTHQEQWVFGMVDTSQQPALGYMEVVQQRDAATLLPIIQAHTAPGTTIHSDE